MPGSRQCGQPVKAGCPVKEQGLRLEHTLFLPVKFSVDASEIWSDGFDLIIQEVPWLALTCDFAEEIRYRRYKLSTVRIQALPRPTFAIAPSLPCISEKPEIQIFWFQVLFSIDLKRIGILKAFRYLVWVPDIVDTIIIHPLQVREEVQRG